MIEEMNTGEQEIQMQEGRMFGGIQAI